MVRVFTSVVRAERHRNRDYRGGVCMELLREFVSTVPSMIKGLKETGKQLFQPTITQNYPEERRIPAQGYRGLPVLLTDPEKDVLACIACELCVKACPVQCITLVWHKVDRKSANQDDYPNDVRTGKALDVYELDASHCLYCGLCAEACPFDALAMSDLFELTDAQNPNQDQYVYNRDELGDIGKLESTEVTGEKLKPYLSVTGIITGSPEIHDRLELDPAQPVTLQQAQRISDEYRHNWQLRAGEEYITPNGETFVASEKIFDIRPFRRPQRTQVMQDLVATLGDDEELLVVSDEKAEWLLGDVRDQYTWEAPVNGPQAWVIKFRRK